MNESLRYFSRHNVWASRTLLDTCRRLTHEQLTAPATAAYGTILQTFNHLVTSDGGYLSALGGSKTSWVEASEHELEKYPDPWTDGPFEPVASLDELGSRIDEMERLWDAFFADEEFNGERICVLDLGTYECPAGVVMAQVFHHGSVHREQICAMLTGFGIEPPDIQPWGFADETGVSRFLGGRTR